MSEGAETATTRALEGEEVEEGKTYTADYVKTLRQEAAEARIKAKQFSAPWEDVTEDDRKVWEEIIRTTQRDPKAGAEYMKRIAKHLSGEAQAEQAAAQAAAAQAGTQAPPALTQADIDRIVSEKVAAAQQQQIIGQINEEAKALGYEAGSRNYMNLLWVAEHETNADLQAAHKKIEDDRNAAVDAYLRQQEEKTGRRFPVATRGGSAPGEKPKEIKTFADAKAAMQARLERDGF